MAPRSWTRTVDIVVKDFPAGTPAPDIAKWVLGFFVNTLPNFKVVSIQQCPGRVARVTFDKDCVTAKDTVEALGEVTINGVRCPVLQPAPLPPRLQTVLVYQYPHEYPNASVASVLDKFGSVKDVAFQHWTNIPDLHTGTRLVRMIVENDIPRFVFIRGIRCKVWYRDQPLTCDICSKGGHKASACPDKGKCLRCHQPGHMARQCPNPWGGAGTASNTDEDDVTPVLIDPALVPPRGDLSQGLVHAEDLDIGLDQTIAADNQSSPPDDQTLADAASVAELILDASSLSSGLYSEPEIEVLEVGVASQPSSDSFVVDERDNQLDELASQQSALIPSNCGPGGAPSGGEFSCDSQIVQSNNNNDSLININISKELNVNTESDSQCSVSILSNCVPDAAPSGGEFVSSSQIESNNNLNLSSSIGSQTNSTPDGESITNYYGSVVSSDGAPPGPVIVDAEMANAADMRKRPISESSSDDIAGEVVGPNSKSSSKKSKKGVTGVPQREFPLLLGPVEPLWLSPALHPGKPALLPGLLVWIVSRLVLHRPLIWLVLVPKGDFLQFIMAVLLCFLMALSILTLNCNGIRDQSKRSGLVQWLRALPVSVDVVCLQETHCVSPSECSSWFLSSGFSSALSPGSIHSCGNIVLFRPSLSLVDS